MNYTSANPFDSLNDDGGGWRQAPQKKRRNKKQQRNIVTKQDPARATDPPKEPQRSPEPEATTATVEVKKSEKQFLFEKAISYFAQGSNHVNKEQRENDVVAVLQDLQNEGYPLQDPNTNGDFRKEVLHRIHVREKGRLAEEDEAEEEVQDDENSSPEESSVEEKQMERVSLKEQTERQVRELNFNEVIAQSILKDWVQKISSSDTSEEIRKEFNKAGAMGFLAESILTSEIMRTAESPRQIRDFTDLLVQLFDHLLQPVDREGYRWFVDQLIEIASNLKKSKALSHDSQTKKLIKLLKNTLMYLQKQTKHGEEKRQETPFHSPSERLFRRIADEHLVKLNISASVMELDKVAKDWHASRDMVTLEMSKHNEEEGPSHKDRIDLFRQIWTQSEEGSKGVRADLKSAQRNRADVQAELDRIRDETFSERGKLEDRKKSIEAQQMRLKDRRKQLEEELKSIDSSLINLNTEHINIQEQVRKMEAVGEPKLEKYRIQLEAINQRIDEKNSERACFESVGEVANRVMEQLESKSNGTRAEQAQWRAKMDQEYLHHGQMYQGSLNRLKERLDTQKTRQKDLVAKCRALEADEWLSQAERGNLRKMRESHVALLEQVEDAHRLVQEEFYQTQVELKRHMLRRSELAANTATAARSPSGWNSFQSLPPATHTTPQMIFDSHQEAYPRKPPVGSIGGATWGNAPMLFKQPSLSKPPQASYTAPTFATPPAALQTLDTFQEQIPQDPIVDTYQAPPLETTTKEEPLPAPTQTVQPTTQQIPRKSPSLEAVAPPRVATSGWNNIVKKEPQNGAKRPQRRIKQVQGPRIKTNNSNRSRGGRSRGGGRYNKSSRRV